MTASGEWALCARTRLTETFGIELPIVLSPLAGGPGTPALAAAVSEAGGLGMLGVGYLSPEKMREAIQETRRLTGKPFGVGLFVPAPVDPAAGIGEAIDALRPFWSEVGIEQTPDVTHAQQDFDEQLRIVLDERVPVVSFTFGVPDRAVVDALKAIGAVVIATATTVSEGIALEDAGVDVVCAQGAEAGGHRGSFLSEGASDMIGLAALTPQLVDTLKVPVIASGGLMDGRGIVAALALGASAVQLGTAFLLCPEAGTSEPYRDALAHAEADNTVITEAFSGKRARGLRNRFTDTMAGSSHLPPYPIMNELTREMRRRAAAEGNSDLLSLWAGQGAPMCRRLPAGELVHVLKAEADAALGSLS